jgi:ABC-type multidrug transport system ATPase subunit
MSSAATIIEEQRPDVGATEATRKVILAEGNLTAVRVRGLIKRYRDGTEANRGIDLDVRRGEILSILGPNGAGKTTFLRQITSELRPTSGSIEIFGLDAIAQPQEVKRSMGITPQEAGVFETLTVREHLELFASLKGLAKDKARKSATEIIHQLGLERETNRRVGRLSGGQRRRILIGLALLGSPPLLVLDEPTTGLDPVSRRTTWEVIRKAVSRGATVILSTHYIDEAEHLSDRIGIISEGRMIALGTLEELLSRLPKSYRFSCRTSLDYHRVQYFSTFTEAQQYAAREGIAEYSLARASLEDVYFELTGQAFEAAEQSEEIEICPA